VRNKDVNAVASRASAHDRLGSTLFLAALLHGVVILGITFTVATYHDDAPAPSLNVTLLIDRIDEAVPERADFLANRNQRGAGRAAAGLRPTSALSAEQPIAQLGNPDGADLVDGAPRELVPSAEQLVSRAQSPDQVTAQPQPTDDPADTRRKAAALIDQLVTQTTAAELDVRAELPNGDDARRTLVATPSTQQSILAEYLDGWRRRVERIGTANYPAQLLGGGEGRPTLEVVIDRDGALESIIVRRSSGDTALDQAALKILRLAAPFEPLPANVRKDYDVLRFAYEWDFFDGSRRAESDQQAGSN
jgi:periplasmic protein TonB